MSSAIPVAPVRLTRRQAAKMRQQQVKKHHVAVILIHWFNAITWLLEIATGAALISSQLFRVTPAAYSRVVTGIFGGRGNLLQFHIALGVMWMIAILPYAVFGFRNYVSREMLSVTDRDDTRWLLVRTLQIVGKTKEKLPPQGIYNAGQKAYLLVVWMMTPVVMLTGIVMAFSLFTPKIVGWAVVLHFASVGAVVAGLIVHVYMGAILPEERPAFFSMITGNVNELYAYSHHFKWWREVKLAEEEWESEQDPDELAVGDAATEKESPVAV